MLVDGDWTGCVMSLIRGASGPRGSLRLKIFVLGQLHPHLPFDRTPRKCPAFPFAHWLNEPGCLEKGLTHSEHPRPVC